MAYPFNESFDAGIPSGFGTTGGSGGITVTWNSTAQAVDLVFTNAQNFWRITGAEQASDFWFEMDVEVTASAAPPPHFGFWLWDGVGTYEGHRLAVWNSYWAYSSWSASGSESEAEVGTSAWWAIVGARKTIRIDAKKSAEGIWAILLTVDGAVTAAYVRRNYASFIPCVFGYGVTLRLHRAAGGTPSALVDGPQIKGRGLEFKAMRRILVPDHAAALQFNHRGLHFQAGTRNHHYHGRHRITGTVKEKGVAVDLPVSRRVLLLDERANFVVRETWSDAATGAYSFEYINPDIRYLVIAYDHKQNFRAAVADNLTAEPMP